MTAAPRWRPAYAYLPGKTPRHPEDRFDRFAFDRADLAGSERWQLALACLREGYFWEAHEWLEPVWMDLPEDAPERALVQGLIQLANAGLKRRMGRAGAVARLEIMARDLLRGGLAAGAVIPGLDHAGIAELWQAVLGTEMVPR